MPPSFVPPPEQSASILDVLLPASSGRSIILPLAPTPVSAGFPSPAEDYETAGLSIHDFLVRNPVSTFIFAVKGESMEGARIFDGDYLVVDRSIEARHGHIVVAFVGGERLVKRLYCRGGRVALLAEHPAYRPLEIRDGLELVIWGVVVGKFSRIAA